jgi:hypothetical protein
MLKPGSQSVLVKKVDFPFIGETTVASMIGTGIGVMLAAAWYSTHYWLLNNLLAFFLALTFLKTLRLTTLVPGMVLLGLLFFYDIFWVFISPYFTKGGTSVMVAVATGLDIPIKLVWPHINNDYPTSACSLLGLGDILIPGIFLTFMARFGFEVVNTSAYFTFGLLSYGLSLIACGVSLFVYKAAQPALLYIVPALFIAVLCIGYQRGELLMLKKGIPPKEEEGLYKNQALSEEEKSSSFGSSVTSRESQRRRGTSPKQFELTRINKSD